MKLIGLRTGVQLLLAGFLAGVGLAQEPPQPSATTSSGTSASASVKKASPAERVILKVGNVQVTPAEFESSIGDFETQGEEGAGASEKNRRALGDDYASVLMLSQKALADHLDSSPEIRRQLDVARLQVLSDAEFASLMRRTEPTFDEISKYYSAHQSDYDEAHIRRLFIWKQRENSAPGLSPQEARTRADKILQAYAAGGDALQLAEEFKGSKDGMFDAEPLTFPRGELPPRMEKVAFALKAGAWAEVEDTPASIMLVQLVKRSPRQVGEVSSLIKQRVQGQKMQAALDDLKRKAGIWMDESYFGKAAVPAPGAQAAGSGSPGRLQKSTTKKEKEKDNEDARQK